MDCSNSTDVNCSTTSEFGVSLLSSMMGSVPFFGFLFGNGGDQIFQAAEGGGLSSSLFTTGVLLLVANYTMKYFTFYFFYIYIWIKGKVFYSLVIKSNDEIFQWIFDYLNNCETAKKSSEMSAHSAWNTRNNESGYMPSVNPFSDARNEKRPTLYYMPYYGVHLQFIGRRPVFIRRVKVEENQKGTVYNRRSFQHHRKVQIESEIIRISTFGLFPRSSMKFLKSVIEECMEKYYSKNENKTFIYTPVPGYDMQWRRTQARSVRTFDSVVLEKGLKEKIKKDVQRFRKSQKWYNARGIPFRRGYMLHGPPGVGKTSYITALAGKLNMSLAILSLNVTLMDDAKLGKLIDDAPRNSLLVIEDVDVALVRKRSSENNNMSSDEIVTLSGLLNALDGIGTGEGRVLFMTTNHIDRLSASLLRPGRCDMKEYFGYASGDQIEQLWLNFYGNCLVIDDEEETEEKTEEEEESEGEEEEEKEDEDIIKKKKISLERVREIGRILRERIPEHFVSPAELQGFYLLHRYDEEGVVDDINRFLEEVKKDRNRMKKEKEEEKKLEEEEKKKKKKKKEKKEKEEEDEEEEEEEEDGGKKKEEEEKKEEE